MNEILLGFVILVNPFVVPYLLGMLVNLLSKKKVPYTSIGKILYKGFTLIVIIGAVAFAIMVFYVIGGIFI